MENAFQTCLNQSREMEQKFQMEFENAHETEAQNFFQKLASEQRTITNQLQNKVGTSGNTATNQQQQPQQSYDQTDDTNA